MLIVNLMRIDYDDDVAKEVDGIKASFIWDNADNCKQRCKDWLAEQVSKVENYCANNKVYPRFQLKYWDTKSVVTSDNMDY
jgi:hypothetical protein